ncbi:MAG TPA: serine hydrolase domain-containing protein [Acidobacteriota bacterium]|nr:serine hydrolase domain-containing protein [Acidobacteriota bacterium]
MVRTICFLVLFIFPVLIQARPLPPAKGKAVDTAIKAYMARHGIPGLSLAVARDGRVIWSKGYGFADLENSVPATSETVYRSASIGKSITATAAMRLVEEKKLDLDQPLQNYCTAFPLKPWTITPRHLLTHTSGIRHYGGARNREEQTSTVHYDSVVKALAPFKDDPLLFEPGTDYSYSTYGYNVLGCVLEGAAKMPFMEVIKNYVFDPAGMTHSRDDDPAVIIPHRAAGYARVDGRFQVAIHVDMSNRLPAGGYVTTAPDLAAFAIKFMDCKLVSCTTRDLMLKELALKNGDTVNYGLGWAIVEDASGRPAGPIFHGGSSPGVSGMLYVVPQDRLAVVILSNLEDAPERLETVRQLADIVIGTPAVQQKPDQK